MIKAGSDKRRADIRMFTGTLIEELMATVERAETKILAAEAADVDCLLAALQENANYDSRYLGVA